MKKAILVLIAFLIAAPVTQAQENWTTVLEPAFEGFLNDTQFLSATEGWAVGSNGMLKRTTDGGLTWTDMATPGYEGATFTSVHFIDSNTGWVGSSGAFLLKTVDGGQNWTEVPLQDLVSHLDVNQFRRVQFLNADVGYMVIGRVNNQYMFKSDDGGTTWAVQDSLIGGNWLDFDFYDVNRGVIVSNSSTGQRYTHDGGETWNQSNTLASVSNLTMLNAVRWVNEDKVIAFGQGNAFQNLTTTAFLSVNGGETFDQVTFDPATTMDVFTGVLVLDEDNMLAFGHNRATRPVVARTTDGGLNWTTELQDYSVNFQQATMAGDRIIVQGSTSSLFYSDDNGATFEFLGAYPYSEIRYIQFGEDYGYAVNSSSKLFSYNSAADAFELVGPSLHNSPGRGNNMYFLDEMTGFIHKGNRQIVKTTDGGQSWTTVLEDLPNNFNNRSGGIWFTDEDIGYAWLSKNTGAAYAIYRTTDGGDTWAEYQTFTGPANIAGVMKFFTDDIGVIAGPRRNIIRTDDAFATEPVTEFLEEGFPDGFSATADFRDMAILNETTAWAVGNGFVVKTTDAGENWEWVDLGIDHEGFDGNFYSVAFSGDRAYAVTFGGYIIKSEDAGATWTVDDTFAGDRIFISASFHDDRIFIGSTIGEIIAGEIPAEGFAVTFNVDMRFADDFDPDVYDVYLSGDFVGWDQPGSNPDAKMTPRDDSPMVYTVTFNLEAGDYAYKYFLVEDAPDWDNSEWPGDPNRTVSVTDDTEINDYFGFQEPPMLTGNFFIPQGEHDRGFADLAEAIDLLNQLGVSGNVTWYITGDLDHSDAELAWIERDDLGEANQLTIRPADGATPVVSFSGAHGLALNNTSWVTIDGDNGAGGHMTFHLATGTGSANGLISINENSHHVAVRNMHITTADAGTTGIRVRQAYSGSSTTVPTNITIEGNTIGSPDAAFVDAVGLFSNADHPLEDVVVYDNLIYAGRRAITTFYVKDNDYHGNTIHVTAQTVNNAWHAGIYLAGGVGDINIHGNMIMEVGVNGTGYASGILLNGSSDAVNVYNNYIAMNVPNQGESEANKVYGIAINFPNAGNPLNIVHNSIYLPETGLTGIHAGFGWERDSIEMTDNVHFVNNIVVNENDLDVAYGIEWPWDTGLGVSDFNNIYVPNGNVGFWDDSASSSLAFWQIATGQDANSVSVAAEFESNTDLSLTGGSVGDVRLAGTPLAMVTTDIFGTTRSSQFPYMGAFEGDVKLGDDTSAEVDHPQEFSLSQNYPNPFNPSTNIQFTLPQTMDVRLEVYDVTGQRVATLVNERREAGVHTVVFDGTGLASGVYVYRITAGSFVQTRKLTFIK